MRKFLILLPLWFACTYVKAQQNDSATLMYDTTSEYFGGSDTSLRLQKDDPAYNPRYSWWKPAIRVVGVNVFNWAVAKYVYKFDWPSSGLEDWKNNFRKGPHWDTDRFGINFIGHPHTGNYYYNVARSNGYGYWGSLPFTIGGSLMWEYLGENEQPSYNDLINTSLSGAFLGEVFYRLSSNILDDRTRGRERVFRELLAGLINPPRALNRLTQGKMFRVTSREVYQKEPMNMSFSSGIHKVNNLENRDNHFGTGASNFMANLQFDYGNPFEIRSRNPFDIFRFRIELSYGADSNLLDNVIGFGLLSGKTVRKERLFLGIFQHFDYWRNNNIFEIGTLGFGGGLVSRTPIGKTASLNSMFHLAVVPLAGNNTEYGPDNSEFRKYNLGGGFQAKWDESLNLNSRLMVGFTSFYYWIHTYNGIPGNSLIAIIKPTITIKIFKNLHIGLEHLIYHNDRYLNDIETLHLTRTEQKLYLQFLFDQK